MSLVSAFRRLYGHIPASRNLDIPNQHANLPVIIPLISAGIVLLFVILSEWLHSRRVKKVASLAFGPEEKPRYWTKVVPWYRALMLAGMAWALVFLLVTEQTLFIDRPGIEEVPEDEIEHALLLCDLSPSMMLADAGEAGVLTRREQMKEVVNSIVGRFGRHVRYTLVCFYTRPVSIVKDASDKEILYNVLNDLPIEDVIGPGKTDLASAVNKGLELVADKPEKSTTFIVVTDGDTLELEELLQVPPSVKDALVLGVGNKTQGISIDGHMSRQDPAVLSYIASHLRGEYVDVNEKLLGSSLMSHLVQETNTPAKRQWNMADLAMLFFIVAACLYAFLPLCQEYLGSEWTAIRSKRKGATV